MVGQFTSTRGTLGNIPCEIGRLEVLRKLYLGYNNGGVPTEFGNLSRLEILSINSASLTGDIPSSVFNISSLTILTLSANSLSGSIPSFQNLPKLEKLYLDINKLTEKVELSADISPPTTEYRRVSYIELEQGTSSFSETKLLGRGSFGSVFEATLSDGLKVAVKVFNMELQGATRSFEAETTILSSIRHRNLVRIVGCCCNKEFKALIMTYVPNGSLDKWLHSNMYGLDLIQRLKIAIDVAAALEYLHHGHKFPVVHCDIKPSNVLLDQDMTAHVADFGISKLFDGGEMFIQTQTVGTIGYAGPELGIEGKVSTNGDVFSFGILLLEMFTGKRPTDDIFGEERSLKWWVSEAIEKNTATELVAPALLSCEDQHYSPKVKCMISVFELAMKCLADSADERINLIEAATALHMIYATIVAGTF
ncbi:probable LRR receptor-like serine/threonine-protein kinase At3g47570 [Salvia hispanica]|uniref:probable LRR receptor-like serine/threonine-protein kinase At3g47570 n=1 Tax=Salvia hispanica TaxID=49212 RepID=UPI0020093AA2|nr:probable LRR receptor-like serine/threonine-protein kinase At3g47570 [Salvia hispanica]